jgi:hypothetical protein
MSQPFSAGNVPPAGQRRFRFGASTALVAFTLLEWPVAILIQSTARADGRLWFEAVTGFLIYSPAIFLPLSALCSIAYFVRLRRAQYIMELALSLTFLALFVAFVELP